jgi:hypothetical protein
MGTTLDTLNGTGYIVVPTVYTSDEIIRISNHISSVHNEIKFGERNFLNRTPGLQELLLNESLRKILGEVAPKHFIIRCTYFDKHPEANWFVSFHRDQTIFVKEKIETFGFKNWTQKENELGVQPPAEYLGDIVTVRIHLDDADETNGALKVVPHTHSEASVRPAAISISDSDSVLCPVKAGGVMLMKPLLFHASSKSTSERPRRVIHLELCSLELPEGLEWAQKSVF